MNPRLLPYVLILPVTLFLCLFFIYPFVLVAQQAFSTGNGFTLDNFRTVTSATGSSRSRFGTRFLLALAVVPIQLALSLADGNDGQPDAKGARHHPVHLDHSARHIRSGCRPHLAGDLSNSPVS